MSTWKIHTPEGVQDILFNDCYKKRKLEEAMRSMFSRYGYYEIETPVVEFYDVFSGDEKMMRQETMFKFFDPQGRILVLRPDITMPIARVAATKLKDSDFPIRASYIGNTFRYDEVGGGKQKEFTQAGVEIIGESRPEADAEVIATAINALLEAGLENFQIDIGQVDFFKGIMEETGLSEDETEKMRVLIDQKDFIGIEELVKSHSIDDSLKNLILEIPRLFGTVEILDKVRGRTSNEKSLKALDNLKQVLEILEDYGLGKYITIDLGLVHSINYYTGIIFKGFTYGVGFPILSGGRYDHLIERFGRKLPATGFGLGVNLLMMALDRQNIHSNGPRIDSLVAYAPGGRKIAYQLAQELRRQGLDIEICLRNDNIEDIKEYARAKEIGGILFISGKGNNDDAEIMVHNLEMGEVHATTTGELRTGGNV